MRHEQRSRILVLLDAQRIRMITLRYMTVKQMEEIPQLVIPTRSKAKISRNLSYPIGAKTISAVLASAAQLPELTLHYYAAFESAQRKGDYQFLRVEYLNNARPAEKGPIFRLYGRPPQGRWEIVVLPVPRILRHRVKQYIIESALPQIARWLRERAQLAQPGNDVLAFFYNDKTDELTPRRLTHLEPLRHRGK